MKWVGAAFFFISIQRKVFSGLNICSPWQSICRVTRQRGKSSKYLFHKTPLMANKILEITECVFSCWSQLPARILQSPERIEFQQNYPLLGRKLKVTKGQYKAINGKRMRSTMMSPGRRVGCRLISNQFSSLIAFPSLVLLGGDRIKGLNG